MAPRTSSSPAISRILAFLVALAAIAGCAVGPAGTAVGTTTGLRWAAAADVSAFAGARVNDVVATSTGFVAVGRSDRDGVAQATVWTSADGSAWTALPPVAPGQLFLRIGPGRPGLVAVAQECTGGCEDGFARIWTSPDGTTWTQRSIDRCCWMFAYADGPSGGAVVGSDPTAGFPAVPLDAAAFSSPDGTTWTRATGDATFTHASIGAIAPGGPGLVALGNSSGALTAWTSTDGRAWAADPGSQALGAGEIRDVRKVGSGLVAVGRDSPGAVSWASPDGRTWTRSQAGATLAGAVMNRLAESGGRLIAVGKTATGAATWESGDGLAWTLNVPPIAADELLAVAANGARTVAIGVTAAGATVVLIGTR